MPPPDSENKGMEVPDHVIDTLARCLLPKIQAYFESPEGQTDFEAWKREHENP
jgi:hypothetical protein